MGQQKVNAHSLLLKTKMRKRTLLGLLILLLPAVAGWAQVAPPMDSFGAVNSPLDEQNPVLSPDGKRLYFTLSNHPQNVGGAKDLGDIWWSDWTPAGWGPPVHAGTAINNTLHNTVAGFSPDGDQLFLMGHYAAASKPVQTQGLAVATREGDRWSTPINILIPYFKNSTPFQSGSLSADGKVLVFSAESYRTLGAEDIYVSRQDNRGRWSEPVNIGSTINTSMQDVSPSLSVDGVRLYFASNGRKGHGSFDIFFSDRLDDSWTRWSEPVNVGESVNSEGRELFYRVFTTGALYTSTQNSDGYGDIRFCAAPISKDSVNIQPPVVIVAVKPVDTLAQPRLVETVYEENTDTKQVRVWGAVQNSKTREPVQASVHFVEESYLTDAKSGADGRYEAWLNASKDYHVRVEAPGYIGLVEKLDLRTRVLKDLELSFQLQPVEVGATVNLKSVLFQQSTAILLKESFDELDMVADFMRQNPKVEIELAGHTDNRGYHQLNMKLSRERVDEVKKYLVGKGIESRRISGRGYGGTKPIADNDAEETRALNRRVEFTIVKD